MKALPLLKHNIDTLLKARHQTRRELAQWVRQSMDTKKIDPWISHIFTNPDAEFQMKYLDRIADFFGIEVYKLFQPGISSVTERRKGGNRRTTVDRRISRAFAMVNGPTEADLLSRLQLLTPDERQKLDHWIDVLRLGRDGGPGTAVRDGQAQTAAAPTWPARRTRVPREPPPKRRDA